MLALRAQHGGQDLHIRTLHDEARQRQDAEYRWVVEGPEGQFISCHGRQYEGREVGSSTALAGVKFNFGGLRYGAVGWREGIGVPIGD